eukprot:13471_1
MHGTRNMDISIGRTSQILIMQLRRRLCRCFFEHAELSDTPGRPEYPANKWHETYGRFDTYEIPAQPVKENASHFETIGLNEFEDVDLVDRPKRGNIQIHLNQIFSDSDEISSLEKDSPRQPTRRTRPKSAHQYNYGRTNTFSMSPVRRAQSARFAGNASESPKFNFNRVVGNSKCKETEKTTEKSQQSTLVTTYDGEYDEDDHLESEKSGKREEVVSNTSAPIDEYYYKHVRTTDCGCIIL